MGFDITYHPISREQMNQWYFSLLNEAMDGTFSKLRETGQAAHLEPFYIDKYIETIKVAANTKPDELFEKTHAYYLAVVQGLFLPYYYTRGTGFSFLIDRVPEMARYTTSWEQIKPDIIACPVTDKITENYSGGIYIAPEQVDKLLADYENISDIHKVISEFYEQNISVFLRALQYASGNKLGLMEATEVVEPNPTDLDKTISYSNLMNCDKEGAYIYRDTALKQIEEFMCANGDNTSPQDALNSAAYNKTLYSNKKEKGSFLKKIFKK